MPPIRDKGLRRVYCQIPLPFWMMIGKVFFLTSSVCDHLFGEQFFRLQTWSPEAFHPWKLTNSHPQKWHHIGKNMEKRYMCPRCLNHFVNKWISFKTKTGKQKNGDPTKQNNKKVANGGNGNGGKSPRLQLKLCPPRYRYKHWQKVRKTPRVRCNPHDVSPVQRVHLPFLKEEGKIGAFRKKTSPNTKGIRIPNLKYWLFNDRILGVKVYFL